MEPNPVPGVNSVQCCPTPRFGSSQTELNLDLISWSPPSPVSSSAISTNEYMKPPSPRELHTQACGATEPEHFRSGNQLSFQVQVPATTIQP